MAELVNEFSWSHSRSRTFRECRRAYWFSYYGHWGGWDRDASERTKLIYALKKITPLAMLVGSIVHKAIFKACVSAATLFTGADSAKAEALLILRDAWRESKTEKWKSAPKRFANLFEHYYGAEVSKERGAIFRERINTCLDAFFTSDVWSKIQTVPAEAMLAMEDLDSFELSGITIYARPDLAFKVGDKVKLYDWKTGKPTEEDEKQITAYAAFALYKRWSDFLENIEPVVFYLGSGEQSRLGTKSFVVDEPAIKALSDKIEFEAVEMQSACADPEMNTAIERNFEFTSDLKHCHNCPFRAVCPGAARSGATPKWLKQPFGPDRASPLEENEEGK